MRNRIIPAVVLVLAGLALAGCYDTSPVAQKIDEPGEYKGPTDPLVAKMGSQLDQRLAARLKMVQTDR
jgi:hypothetical protein